MSVVKGSIIIAKIHYLLPKFSGLAVFMFSQLFFWVIYWPKKIGSTKRNQTKFLVKTMR